MDSRLNELRLPPVEQNLNDSLYLSGFDNPRMELTNEKFNGTNFLPWNRAVRMSLGAKLKLGLLKGLFQNLMIILIL